MEDEAKRNLYQACRRLKHIYKHTGEPAYNDVGLFNISYITSVVKILTVNHNITLLGYNNTRL